MNQRSFLDRAKSKVQLLAEILMVPFYRNHYDWRVARKIRLTPGDLPQGNEVGIYLIFPETGLLASHIAVLEAMLADGISPLVVSNLALTQTERTKLASLSYLVMERPNIGYDFAGYRDAILHLRPVLAGLNRLWILNDSSWMIDQPESWFSQARKLGVDFAAASYARVVHRKTGVSDAANLWPPDFREKPFHYGSFALAVGPNVLRDSRFLRYWKRLAITNSKKLTIRRGEHALTRLIINSGFSHAATCDFAGVEANFKALSSLELERTVRDAYFYYDRYLHLYNQVLATDHQSDEGRKRRVDYLMYLVCREGPAYALGIFAIRHMGFHFLKKSPVRLSPVARDRVLEFLSEYPARQRDMIAAEIRMITADGEGRDWGE